MAKILGEVLSETFQNLGFTVFILERKKNVHIEPQI